MTNPSGTRMIFSIKYAGQLMKMGHQVLGTLPNPRKPKLDMFLFAADEDFKKLQEGDKHGCRNN